MNKTVKGILAGLLALLGFSSCSSLREAREAREARERAAYEAQQRELAEQTLREMLERDANDPERIREWEKVEVERIIREREERTKLLYAVPNVPYREVQEKK